MKVINFLIKYSEYALPFIGILLTGIGFKFSSIIVPIQENFSDALQLELDLAFNILMLFIIKNIFSVKDYYTIEASLVDTVNSENELSLKKITELPNLPQIIKLNVQINKANLIKGDVFIEIKYARNIEMVLDYKPEGLKCDHNHENKSIIINLNTLFNFSLKKPQKDVLRFKVLSNSVDEADSSIELHVLPSKLFDKLKIKKDIQPMKINIK